MPDLDENGNVDYSNSPSHKTKSNHFDIRRELKPDSDTLVTKLFTIGNSISKFPWIEFVDAHTVEEITGVSRATEGVTIRLTHGFTNEIALNVWINNIAVGITSGTGDAATYPTDKLFFINGDIDPTTSNSPEIFIPIQDMSRVVIVPVPNQWTMFEKNSVYSQRYEITIT